MIVTFRKALYIGRTLYNIIHLHRLDSFCRAQQIPRGRARHGGPDAALDRDRPEPAQDPVRRGEGGEAGGEGARVGEGG